MTKSPNGLINTVMKIRNLLEESDFFVYLIAAILVTIPLKNIFSTILIVAFMVASLFYVRRKNTTFSVVQILPMLLYLLMIVSLIWSHDPKQSLFGLQKLLSFFFIPVAFVFIPKIDKNGIVKIAKLFSYGMVVYALFYIVSASIRYYQTQNVDVFFYHELVNKDLNVIYFSVLVSFALFYFISLKEKKFAEKAFTLILIVLLLLMSSKSIITIDIIILVCYYYYFVDIPKTTKTLTVFSVVCFLTFSVLYVEEAKERFLLEYETAFIDNTVNNKMSDTLNKVYNVSVKHAWTKDRFEQNNFFPGTALRVYQTRIFLEMLNEQDILFTGFGLEASQHQIHKKAKEHNLFPSFGMYNFHNQYIQTFAELGVFGLLILISMLLLNFKNAWKHKDFLHIAFAITMIMLFLSESFFCRQRGIVFFIFLYCLFNMYAIKQEKKTAT
jgi:O-antigen ligase